MKRRYIKCMHLYDLANDGGFVARKRAGEDREVWRHRERMSKTCCTAEDYRLTVVLSHTDLQTSFKLEVHSAGYTFINTNTVGNI